ncbi:hypothetical protein MACK_003805 [Theileria orientalis]|uniref:Uncharacterized protein n=1 Tax=Theileria orientalis TaxID=68886 RepID=A0A976XJS4_THEOR|nr:hypothetical protein MACK_003805 [Theileria orientalis]
MFNFTMCKWNSRGCFRSLRKGIQRNIGESLHISRRRIKLTIIFEFIGYFELLLEIRVNRNLKYNNITVLN